MQVLVLLHHACQAAAASLLQRSVMTKAVEGLVDEAQPIVHVLGVDREEREGENVAQGTQS